MTKEEIEKAKALCEAATPGPWTIRQVESIRNDPDWGDEWIVDMGRDRDSSLLKDIDTAEFIAASRELVPKLIAEVERLQGQIDIWVDT